jgi:ATP adenylyltransferase
MSDCCFCPNLVSARTPDFWNKALLETANFVAIPSLGSLVEGWLLIVPKKHFICMGALPVELLGELRRTKDAVASALMRRYGEVCAFEHGPHSSNRQIGCGVDHAHLHILPLDFDLKQAAEPFMPPDARWEAGDFDTCRAVFADDRDYHYIEQPLGCGRIATSCGLGSQIFRKAIAAHLGVPDEFGWRNYPRLEVISKTIQALSGPEGIIA